MSIRDTVTRNVVKVTGGYKFNKYVNIELSANQTDYVRLAHSKNKNRVIGGYIVFCLN